MDTSQVSLDLKCGVSLLKGTLLIYQVTDYQCSAVTKTTYSKKIKHKCYKIEGPFYFARIRLWSALNASVKE